VKPLSLELITVPAAVEVEEGGRGRRQEAQTLWGLTPQTTADLLIAKRDCGQVWNFFTAAVNVLLKCRTHLIKIVYLQR